jgi:hypothetical protein
VWNLRKKKSPNKRTRAGRPKRAAAASKALTALAGIDPDSVDLRRILAAIASDPAAPASARVAACRVLKDMPPKDDDAEDHPAPANGAPADGLSQRAIDLLNRRRLN